MVGDGIHAASAAEWEGELRLDTIYVYGRRAFTSNAAAGHDPTLRRRLARRVPWYGLPPRLVFRVRDGGVDQIVVDPVEVRHLLRDHPLAHVTVIPIEQ